MPGPGRYDWSLSGEWLDVPVEIVLHHRESIEVLEKPKELEGDPFWRCQHPGLGSSHAKFVEHQSGSALLSVAKGRLLPPGRR